MSDLFERNTPRLFRTATDSIRQLRLIARSIVGPAEMVEAGGLFAIQIPAVGTTLRPGHEVVEQCDTDGFSICPAGSATLLFYFVRADVAELITVAGLTPVVGPLLVESPQRGIEGGVVRNWLLGLREMGAR